jgi:predicted glutamine amidotransferase
LCRLLGLYGQIEFWQELLYEFQKQADNGKVPPGFTPGHTDSWGITSSNSEKNTMIPLERQLGSASKSPIYKEAISSLERQPHIILGHLRKASPEISVSYPNTHPFYWQNWAFIHNGTVYNAESLPRDTSMVLTSDKSDSEYYFHYMMTKLNELGSRKDIEVIVAALESIPVLYASLNCLFSNGMELFSVRWCDKLLEYYTLYYYELKTGIIISSEPIQSKNLNLESWTEFPSHSVAKVTDSPPKIEIITL